VESIEHGTFLDEAGARAMKAHGTYYSATLMAFSGVQSLIGTGKLAPESEAKAKTTFAVWGKGLNLAYRSGVKIALGTDSAVAPHSQANKELALMVEKGGMTPRDALVAATKGGPDLLGLAGETGTLDPGKSADLIAVEGDPLVDPAAVQHVDYVMVAGRPIPMKGQ
jgi:imidazolonepropionase-like amidohydrolase